MTDGSGGLSFLAARLFGETVSHENPRLPCGTVHCLRASFHRRQCIWRQHPLTLIETRHAVYKARIDRNVSHCAMCRWPCSPHSILATSAVLDTWQTSVCRCGHLHWGGRASRPGRRNLFTTVSDMFPKPPSARVTAIGVKSRTDQRMKLDSLTLNKF